MLSRVGRPFVVLVAVLTIAAATGFILMAVSASAGSRSSVKATSTSTISIQTKATLTVGGKGGFPGADVTIKYSCFPAPSGGYGGKGGYFSNFGNVTVSDLNGTSGSGFFTPTCDDTKNTAVVFVPGNFAAGDAASNAFLCGFDCALTSKEIKLSS
ncbi:MAG TPA: hypothetical protein VFK22_08390 [Candidatus Dormibacteraeota bacterium]|nr:hypothetical protein [Candidatus Dormibacteraeota bacterium]